MSNKEHESDTGYQVRAQASHILRYLQSQNLTYNAAGFVLKRAQDFLRSMEGQELSRLPMGTGIDDTLNMKTVVFTSSCWTPDS